MTTSPAHADLSELSIEQLIDLRVTTVAKRPQRVADAAAAVFVITQEDIRRSGATTIAEILRQAPGLNVARVNANSWAISSRGFNLVFADKLLVLIDGRTVYTPLFSGVYWDIQDVVLEDIDRIEVIRGPGATLWGANAVNGVINIITKKAGDSQGALISGGGGTEEQGFGTVRYGGKIGEDSDYRVYSKYFNRGSYADPTGASANDSWRGTSAGMRFDSRLSESDSLTVQGDGYYMEEGSTATVPLLGPPYREDVVGNSYINGANILSRWTRSLSEQSELQGQIYYDRTDRYQYIAEQAIDTFDVELQHRSQPFQHHELIYGIDYRMVHDDLHGSEVVSFSPESRTTELFAGFLQDEIELSDDLRLTFGSKLEHNSITNFEYQPSARVLYAMSETSSVWGALSRAVRTPNRANEDVRWLLNSCPAGSSPECPGPAGVTDLFQLNGNRSLHSEQLLAYEAGIRNQLTEQLSVDLALFYNRYDSLVSTSPGMPFPSGDPSSPQLVFPVEFGNDDEADTYGFEFVADYRPTSWWRLVSTYSYLDIDFHEGALATGNGNDKEFESPDSQISIRSLITAPGDLEFDATLRYVDALPVPSRPIDSYFNLDLRIGWRAERNLDIELVGQNLLEEQHGEFASAFVDQSVVEVQRGVFGRVTWRY